MAPTYNPKGGTKRSIAKLNVSKLTPEGFWASHIATRKPALIRGHPIEMAWRASGLWTDEFLVRRAGGAEVLVEVRGGPREGYGRGVKRRMTFGEFVGRVAAGETGLYLTAQQVSEAPDGHPQLMAEPLLSLAGASNISGSGGGKGGGSCDDQRGATTADFPASLELAGHLVPQSLNLWMGVAPEGSSSGLHHDFHDNFYVLLRGKKRFRIYPPSAAPMMYTYGKLVRQYENGRIVYEGQGDILADGTDAADVARWRRRTAAEAAVAEAEAAVSRGEPGARNRLEQSEAALEAALEAELSDALEDGDGYENGLGEQGDDDFDSEEEEISEEEEKEEEADFMDVDGKGKASVGRGGGKGLDRYGTRSGVEAGLVKEKKVRGKQGGSDDLIEDPDTPPSFSRVPLGDPGVSDAQLAAEFPRFPGRAAALEVTVEAGDMLFLPAGWFHEVTSYGPASGPDSGHLAFNYWFHPPDNLDPSRRGFRAPYNSDFWPSLWRSRVAEGRPDGLDPGLGPQQPPSASDTADTALALTGAGVDVAGTVRDGDGLQQGDVHRGMEAGERGIRMAAAASGKGGQDAGTRGGMRSRLEGLTSHGDNGGDDERGDDRVGEGADGDEDLNPPRRKRAAAAVRALVTKLAEARADSKGGETAAELTEEEYQLLMAMEAARRRNTAVQAMRVFFEKRMKLERYRRMRARLPPGRRHHPVIAVRGEGRNWRPQEKKVPTLPGQQERKKQQQ